MHTQNRVGLAVTLSVVLALSAVQTASAWTQLRNNYPDAPLSCGDNPNDAYPCIKWPQSSSGYSITVYVYLAPSLSTGNINLHTDMLNGMSGWNSQPARNPFFISGSSAASKVSAHRSQTYRSDIWAQATTYANTAHTITSATIIFNVLVTWNRNYTWGAYVADARKVATHETGHTQALGHTGILAIMKKGEVNLSAPQTNDRQGLQAIYGAS